MMNSMTAFAVSEKDGDGINVKMEIRSYNSRYLDIFLRLPQEYASLEEKIKNKVSRVVHRGRVEIKIQIHELEQDAVAFEVDAKRAAGYHEALQHLKETLNIPEPIQLEHILGVGGMIRPMETEKDLDSTLWPLLDDCIGDALQSLDKMRQREGAAIAEDFEKRLACIETTIEDIRIQAKDLPALYRQRLEERISALTRGMVELDPVRVTQEASFLADRSDISEEIVRAKSHVEQFRELMKNDEPAGKKLNFLLQELNREFNTMGSKTGKAKISHQIVDLKAELEKIREQVQNIE
jgi:uncharacterized protein (TIGR00255 family)